MPNDPITRTIRELDNPCHSPCAGGVCDTMDRVRLAWRDDLLAYWTPERQAFMEAAEQMASGEKHWDMDALEDLYGAMLAAQEKRAEEGAGK
jgi:hypothetical protein